MQLNIFNVVDTIDEIPERVKQTYNSKFGDNAFSTTFMDVV